MSEPVAPIYALSGKAVDLYLSHSPLLAAEHGLVVVPAFWDDLRPAAMERRMEELRALLADVEACEVHGGAERLAKTVLAEELRGELEVLGARLWTIDLNNITSPWQSCRDVFAVIEPETDADWDAAATLLASLDHYLDGYRHALSVGIEEGNAPQLRQVATALEQGRESLATSPFQAFAARYDGADEGVRQRLHDAAGAADQAFAAMAAWIATTLQPIAPDTFGVGRQNYPFYVRKSLGDDIDIDATYTWAWTKLDELLRRRDELCEIISPGQQPLATLEQLETDPDLMAHGVDEFLDLMRQRQEYAFQAVENTQFTIPSSIRTVQVKVPPPGGASAAHYTGPSNDLSKPGAIWYPIYGRTEFPLYGEITTAYHEGVPGHHLQVAYSMAIGDQLSDFHRCLVWHPGTGEGWALYAETLMLELGHFEQPHYELGYVVSQLFRTVRVVIDIGLHCHLDIPACAPLHGGAPWTPELAEEYLRVVARLHPLDATSEVTRYLGWAGQAITYKLGEQAILDLRDQARQADTFDLREFHARLLTIGAVGVRLLRELMASDLPALYPPNS